VSGSIELSLADGTRLSVPVSTQDDLSRLSAVRAKELRGFTFIDVHTEDDFALVRDALDAARECVYVDPAARKVRTIRGVKP
jgi:hypothetical protein